LLEPFRILGNESRRVRILVVHNRYQIRGGEDVAVDGEIEALARAGFDVTARIVTNDAVRGLSAKLGTAMGTAHSPVGVRLVREAIRETRPDVLHVHNFFPLVSPAVHAAAHAEGVATVQTLHNFRTVCAGGLLMRDGRPCETCIGGSPWWGAWHACYRGSAMGSLAVARMIDAHRRAGTWRTQVDCFVVMSEFARGRFTRAGFPPDKMVVKPNSVDDPGLPPEGARAGILSAGRLSEEKGVHVLIEAARRTTARIEVIGEGPLAAQLQAAAPGNVVFRGPLPRAAVRKRIASAEALVVPSVCYEGSPMVIAEAFAAGTPVIASRIGALEDLVEDGRTGLQAAPGDPADLAGTLGRIVADKAGARLMGRRARARYEAEWSPRANVAALARIYADAVAAFRARDIGEAAEPQLAAAPAIGGGNGA
jgi:glycosyltransferase involved in cell wall biosynthesis